MRTASRASALHGIKEQSFILMIKAIIGQGVFA